MAVAFDTPSAMTYSEHGRSATRSAGREEAEIITLVQPEGATGHLPSSWFEEAEFRIQVAYSLDHNWDDEGALPVRRLAAQNALRLAHELSAQGISRPFVGASQGGGIEFEWSGERTQLIIEVTTSEYLVTVRDRDTQEYWEGTHLQVRDQLRRALDSLTV
ncbi:MAG: hypothetical protein KJ698_13485 [Actinobacteria bacterium]|nr:hypothetical protein [Actinomycetota bacterium]MBU1493949.1 hypothetical protein [Actinomycetota bacterium]MBU1866262.1 hypothetical protein [Actinomycetota bacterium]